jgi:hypothetical protein
LVRQQAIVALAGLVYVSACADAGQLEGNPQIAFQSQRAPTELAACISEGWLNHGYYPANVQPRQDGSYVVILPGVENLVADAVARIAPTGSGSTVAYSERVPSMSPEWFQAEVRNCL